MSRNALGHILPDGRGIKVFESNEIIMGSWRNGELHGRVRHFYDNFIFDGNYERGKKHGFGAIYYRSGEIEQGEYFKGKKDRVWTYYKENEKSKRINFKRGSLIKPN